MNPLQPQLHQTASSRNQRRLLYFFIALDCDVPIVEALFYNAWMFYYTVSDIPRFATAAYWSAYNVMCQKLPPAHREYIGDRTFHLWQCENGKIDIDLNLETGTVFQSFALRLCCRGTDGVVRGGFAMYVDRTDGLFFFYEDNLRHHIRWEPIDKILSAVVDNLIDCYLKLAN